MSHWRTASEGGRYKGKIKSEEKRDCGATGKSPPFAKARRVGKIRRSARLCGRKDLEILRFGNSNPPALTSLVNVFRSLLAGEAYEEEAKKPSIGIIDAQEGHAEADEKKESGKNRAR